MLIIRGDEIMQFKLKPFERMAFFIKQTFDNG